MEQVVFQTNLDMTRADKALRRTANLGDQLFSKKGFKINISTSGLPLGRITGDFDNFRKSLDAATERVTAFTATTGIIYGLADAFSRLFSESVKLEKQLASIQSILRVSGSELTKLSDDLLQVANATSQSFEVAVDAAVEFSRQGLTLNKTIEATNAALALSKIAGIDAASAVQSLTATLNTFNSEGLTYQKVLDTITALDNNFAASASGIADGLKRVGSVASEAGLELKEIASLITSVQQISARGEVVIANGFKTISTRLNRSDVQEKLAAIGIQSENANGEFRSQIDILTDLANKFDDLSDKQQAYISETVAGVYQINTLQSILKAVGGESSLYAKALDVAGNSAGDTAARLRVLTDTASSSLQVLQNNLQRTFANLGSKTVLPLIKDFTSFSNSVLGAFNTGDIERAFGEIDTRSAGEKMGAGLIDGIASFLSSSGTTILVAVLGSLVRRIFKDVFKGITTLTGVNSETLVNAELQNSVNKAIAQGNQSLVQRLATTDSLIDKNRILNQLLLQQNQLGNLAITDTLVTRGLAKNNIKTKARGFIPALLKEQKDIDNGVGGASKNAKPLIRELNLGKGKEKVVVNSDELLVQNYLNSGKDAIFNKQMIRDAGGIKALQSLGKVKRFAQGSPYKQLQDLYSQEAALYNQSSTGGDFASTKRGKQLREALARTLSGQVDNKLVTSLVNSSPFKPSRTDPIQDLSFKGSTLSTNLRSSNVVAGQQLNTGAGGDPFESNQNLKARKYNLASKQAERARTESAKIRQQVLNQEKEELRLIEEANKQNRKAQRSSLRNQLALGASIGAPLVAGTLASAFGGESEGSQRAVRGIESGSIGLSIAALTGFTPLGIAAGALVGTFSFLKKEAEANVNSFEKVKKSADKIIAANQAQLNAVQNTIQAQNTLNELNKSNSSVQDRARAQSNILSSVSQISDREIQKILLSGDQSKDSQQRVADFQDRLQQSSRVQEGLLVAAKSIENAEKKRTGVAGLFGKQGETAFDTADFGAFLDPIISSIDRAKLASGEGAKILRQYSSGILDGAEFFNALGSSLIISSEAADAVSKQFKNLNNVMSADSIEALRRYIADQIEYKNTLDEISKSLATASNFSVRFKKAFDISIKNLSERFSFENFESSARARSGLTINRQLLQGQSDLGTLTQEDLIKELAKISTQEADLNFTNKSNEVFEARANQLLSMVSGKISPEKQGALVGQITSLFEGKSSLADVEQSIKELIGVSDTSEELLTSIKTSSVEVGKEISKLLVELGITKDEITANQRVQLAVLRKGPATSDILTGKTDQARANLLNKTVDNSLTKQISDLNKKIQRVGSTSKEGIALTSRRDAVVRQQQILRQRDLEARSFLLPGTNPKLSSDALKQENELKQADFYKTNAELLKKGLEEVNSISIKKTGGRRFGDTEINKVSALLASGQTFDVSSFLDSASARTFNPQIKSILEDLKKSVTREFQSDALETQSVQLPQARDFSSDINKFSQSLGNTLPADFFTKGAAATQRVSEAEQKTKEAADALALTASQLSTFSKETERNNQIIQGDEDRFKKNLGADIVAQIRAGEFTRGEAANLEDFKKRSLIERAGFVLPDTNRGTLVRKRDEQSAILKETEERQKRIEEESSKILNGIKNSIDKLIETQSGNKETPVTSAKIEQDVAIAVQVSGIDERLISGIRSAVTALVDSRIKEKIKDTFNVDVVSKPTSQLA